VENPDFFDLEAPPSAPQPSRGSSVGGGLWSVGDRVTWIAGLVLMLSSFMGWYSGSGVGIKLAVIGWHTGVLGKLVFFIGLAVVALAVLRDLGVELPATVPDSLVTVALGSLGTIFVLIRLISIPDTFAGTSGRGIGIWISLLSGIAVILGGLLKAGEEL